MAQNDEGKDSHHITMGGDYVDPDVLDDDVGPAGGSTVHPGLSNRTMGHSITVQLVGQMV